MKRLFVTFVVVLGLTGAAQAMERPLKKIAANQPVPDTMDALESAVVNAGARVFARVNHGAGAASIDQELAPSELLVFGNPKIGTPAMQADPRAGLFLPLKVLVYQDANGQVWLAYEDPAEMLGDLDIPSDAPFLAAMTGALGKLTSAAAGE